MDLNKYLPELEQLEEKGAVILLKWDGERDSDKRTIVILKPGTEYQFHQDTDDLAKALEEGISDFYKHFPEN